MKRLAALALAVFATLPAAAAPISILFVGNSYTFGRLDPVLTYNAANVRDLTKPQGPVVDGSTSGTPKFSDVTGTNSYAHGLNNPGTGNQGNSYSPHSQTNGWGGVAGIFKQFTVQAGLDYDVALSTRNAATLRGHFLNTANSTNWDLRGNISSQKWDKMVLQEQSDEALGPQTVNGVPLGSNFPSIRAYVDLIEDWVHTGRPIQAGVMTNNPTDTTYRERNMYYLGGTVRLQRGGPGGQYANEAACVAAGGTPGWRYLWFLRQQCRAHDSEQHELQRGDRDLPAADLGPTQLDQLTGCNHHRPRHRQRHLHTASRRQATSARSRP